MVQTTAGYNFTILVDIKFTIDETQAKVLEQIKLFCTVMLDAVVIKFNKLYFCMNDDYSKPIKFL